MLYTGASRKGAKNAKRNFFFSTSRKDAKDAKETQNNLCTLRGFTRGIINIPNRIKKTVSIIILMLCLLTSCTRPTTSPPPPAPTASPALPDTAHQTLINADELLGKGHYYQAYQTYQTLQRTYPDNPEVLLRLGIIAIVRGEYEYAEQKLRQARRSGITGDSHDIALLYLSYVLYQQNIEREARLAWKEASATSHYQGVAHIVQAEWELQHGNSAIAYQTYQKAKDMPLPTNWLPHLVYRLALLQAPQDSDGALSLLTRFATHYAFWTPRDGPFAFQSFAATIAPVPLVQPLLPDSIQESTQFIALLQTDGSRRAQLLGQWYLRNHLYPLAADQFAQVDAESHYGLMAQTYGAYTLWRAGSSREAIAQLQHLTETAPDYSHARIFLALMLLKQQAYEEARQQNVILSEQFPDEPDVQISWAHWHDSQSDYKSASLAYQEALKLAPNSRRGNIALQAAQFYLKRNYLVCDAGLSAAEYAAPRLIEQYDAWATLTAFRFQCGNIAGTIDAAERALDLGRGADVLYYSGMAYAALGRHDEAHAALVAAADAAPASVWRRQAEEASEALKRTERTERPER